MKIKISFGAILMPFILLLSGARASSLLSLLSAVLFHEIGHLTTILILKKKIKSVTFETFGARIIMENEISYSHELLISLAGPISSFFLFLLLKSGSTTDYSLFLGIINLLPVPTLDGGRALCCAVSYFWGPEVGERTVKACGKMCIFVLWLFAAYLVLRYDGGFGLFAYSFILAAIVMRK